MKYPRILAKIITTPWAILPTAFDGITRALNGDAPQPGEEPAEPSPAEGMAPVEAVDSVAVIHVCGIIGKHLSGMEIMCGGCCLDQVRAAFDSAVIDANIKDIVLVFDSPGGTVPGVPEFARHIRESALANGKRLHAYTDSLCASAAYWIASACDRIVCSPTATLGSIGVYVAFEDRSKANEMAGVKLNLIKAGKFKDMYSDARPPTDEELGMMQGSVDSIWAMFKASVVEGRGNSAIAESSMEGQCFMGAAAVSAGLADELCPDLETFISEFEPLGEAAQSLD